MHVADGTVRVEGPKGKLARRARARGDDRRRGQDGDRRSASDDSRRARSVHGLTRKLVANMVEGVARASPRVLEINGVGYRAEARGHGALPHARLLASRSPTSCPRASRRRSSAGRRSRSRARDRRAARPGRRGDPRAAAARALQGQGRQVRRGDDPPQGRQGGRRRSTLMRTSTSRVARERRRDRVRAARPRHRRAAAALGVPQRPAHLRRRSSPTVAARRCSRSRRSPPSCARSSARRPTSTPPSRSGSLAARRCQEKGITRVVFDRNGFLYHGRVRAVAEGAREGGLEF